MPRAPGTRFGPYEIVAAIGAGGMGEVYLARDTRLKRDVALKTLPANVAADPERLARFQREAEILASLNHPHIAAIYGLEETDGQQALALELVDGDTLADRIARGRIPVAETLAIARQIAAALEAAHEQGIVHRDLKPANIKVRPDGTVKVLDFGLAKLHDPNVANDPNERSLSATVTSAGLMTGAGVILGTTAFMSPEQATGQPVDARTDIWAFGCVLYEMLTGRRAFAGATIAETVASVLAATPDWSQLPKQLSPAVRVLLRRCLAREPPQRLGDMSAVRFVLDEEQALSGGTVLAAGSAKRSPARRAAILGGGVLATAAAVAAALVWLAGPPAESAPVVRTTVSAATFMSGVDHSFALTPDGRHLAYVSANTGQILVRPLDRLDATPILTTPSDIRGLFTSTDGRSLGYIENNFTLKRIDIGGGSPTTVWQSDGPSRGAAWGPDDTIVFATAAIGTGLQQVAASGGQAEVLTRPDPERGESDHVHPAWLPDGRGLLFTILASTGGIDAAKIAVLDRETGRWRTVRDGAYYGRYVSTGHLVYGAAGALWAIRFDLARQETQGAPVKVLPHVSVGAVGVAQFDVARNGTLIYARNAPDPSSVRRNPVWVDRTALETPLAVPPDNYTHPRLSPDGRRLAIVAQGDIYVWDMARPWSAASRMTFHPRPDWFPVWTPDGKLVFGSWRDGASNLYVQSPDSATPERLTDSTDMQMPTSLTPDGATVIFHSFARSLQSLRLAAPHQPITLVESPLEERNGVISPNGHWMAYEAESSTRPGELDVHVRPFPDVDRGLWQVTKGGGTYPVWSHTGSELFYATLDGAIHSVPVEAAGTAWKIGSVKTLFRGRYVIRGIEGSLGRHFDVARDGRFLMLKDTDDPAAASPHFVVVQNWFTELARQVP